MTLPDFFVIGAGSAGTTSLYYSLRQHPEIYMSPVKEPNFFAIEKTNPDHRELCEKYVCELQDYADLFEGANGEKALGEASTRYLHSTSAPQRIRETIPGARLIAVLRQPIDRAYSHFNRDRRDGLTDLQDFVSAVRTTPRPYGDGQSDNPYIDAGFYHKHLVRYYRLFDRSQIKVFLYEELRQAQNTVLKELFGFLDVDDSFVPDSSARHNVSGTPRLNWLHRFLVLQNPVKRALNPIVPYWLRRAAIKVKNVNLSRPAPIEPELRAELIEVYRDDLTRLQDLIDRDLSHWLN